jgi:hypothetical protein
MPPPAQSTVSDNTILGYAYDEDLLANEVRVMMYFILCISI